MITDKVFCMSSYLMYRYVYDDNYSFSDGAKVNNADMNFSREPVKNYEDLLQSMKKMVDLACADGKAALALSGGIDSAILASLVPKGTKAYTFRCVVPGVETIDESKIAARWAEINGLDHEIIDIYWEDLVPAVDECMKTKNAPVHSIEGQIYFAAKKCKEAGFTKFIFGENADVIYGGMNGLIAKDWTYAELIDRYSYVMPYKVLKKFEMPVKPFQEFEVDGSIDGYDFSNKYYRQESLGSYVNACGAAGIEFIGPYSRTSMAERIDYARIRSGDTKYIVRELFKSIYPGEYMPEKIPMPRPVDEWLKDWEGPVREEFIPKCTANMNGNQKWMVWCLERYLNSIDSK